MAEVLDSTTPVGTAIAAGGPLDGVVIPTQSKWYRWRKDGTALAKYLLDSEVQTYAFSVAANAILSFIPFIVLLYTLARAVFHSTLMVGVVNGMVDYFFPSNQDWVAANLAQAAPRHSVQFFSLLMILVSCTGIFVPLEVALNQAWGVTKGRNLIMNQVVAFGLALWMVVLGLLSIGVNAAQRSVLAFLFFHHTEWTLYEWINYGWMAITGSAAGILFFFSIYWVLPNCKVPWRPVLKTSIYTGLIWIAAKYVFVLCLPLMDLRSLYGPFYVSVGLLFWSYVSGLILFAGAQFSVSRLGTER